MLGALDSYYSSKVIKCTGILLHSKIMIQVFKLRPVKNVNQITEIS